MTGVDDGAYPADFATWVRPHLPAMAALAARLAPHADRDDVVQEALVRAWRRRSTYQVGRGSARVWLLAIVADRARTARKNSRSAQILHDDGTSTDVDSDLDLDLALRQLSHRQRLAVALHYFVGLSVSEAAEVMRCTPGTVKSTLYDARHRLSLILEVDHEG